MLTIDTHCHASPSWFEPIEVLLFQMNQHAVDRSVLIQIRGEFDNGYLIECARRFPRRFSVVASVDIDQPEAPETLGRWASEGIEGVRLGPIDRSPGRDPLAIWRKASALGLVISCLGLHEEFASDEFRKLVEELPEMPFIIEHLGFIGPNAERPYSTYRRILALARYPNVYMKVPGLGQLMPRPTPMREPPFDLSQAPPFIGMAIEAFSPNRLMIATDYPPSSAREGYGNVVRYIREYLSRRSQSDQEAILGRTAASLFKFGAG